MVQVRITGPAQADIAQNYEWWSKHRSKRQADRWYVGMYEAMRELGNSADQHALATENGLKQAGVQQVSFGIGRSPTHRILYRVSDSMVIVFRIRAFKLDAIGVEDLGN